MTEVEKQRKRTVKDFKMNLPLHSNDNQRYIIIKVAKIPIKLN